LGGTSRIPPTVSILSMSTPIIAIETSSCISILSPPSLAWLKIILIVVVIIFVAVIVIVIVIINVTVTMRRGRRWWRIDATGSLDDNYEGR